MRLGADEENISGETRTYLGISQLKAVQESRALLPYVETRNIIQTQFGLNQSSGTGKIVIRGHGGKNNQIQIFPVNSRHCDRVTGSGSSEIRRGDSFVYIVPTLHSAPSADPFIIHIHYPGQHVICNPFLWDTGSTSDNHSPAHTMSSD